MTYIGHRRANTDSAPFTRVYCLPADAQTAERIEAALVDELTTVTSLASWSELEDITAVPDVLILDHRVPKVASMRSLLSVRHRWPCIGIVATEVTDEVAATELLGWGVDDAIESRCSADHVAARLGAAARRARTENASLRRRIGDVVYDRDSRRVWCDGVEVLFARREIAVLDCLWRRAGEYVEHETLHDFVWSGFYDKSRTNRVEVYISYVRRKLRRSRDVAIETRRGKGYRLIRRDQATA